MARREQATELPGSRRRPLGEARQPVAGPKAGKLQNWPQFFTCHHPGLLPPLCRASRHEMEAVCSSWIRTSLVICSGQLTVAEGTAWASRSRVPCSRSLPECWMPHGQAQASLGLPTPATDCHRPSRDHPGVAQHSRTAQLTHGLLSRNKRPWLYATGSVVLW